MLQFTPFRSFAVFNGNGVLHNFYTDKRNYTTFTHPNLVEVLIEPYDDMQDTSTPYYGFFFYPPSTHGVKFINHDLRLVRMASPDFFKGQIMRREGKFVKLKVTILNKV